MLERNRVNVIYTVGRTKRANSEISSNIEDLNIIRLESFISKYKIPIRISRGEIRIDKKRGMIRKDVGQILN